MTKSTEDIKQKRTLWQKIIDQLKPYLLALFIAFFISGIIIGLLGYNIFNAYQTMLFTTFYSRRGFIETLIKFIPLTFATYAFAVPFKIKFFNIGGLGQMLFGATMTAIVGIALAKYNLSSLILIFVLILVALFAGAFLALIAGALKAYYNINPIISTIMLNFIALYFVNFIATTAPWKEPFSGHPMTKKIPEAAILPKLFNQIHFGIIIVIISIFVIYFLMNKTVLGYEIKATGLNPTASSVYGIKMKNTLMVTFMLGGAMAGLGGGIEVMGVHLRLIEGFALTSGAQYGIFGVLTALLCQGNLLGVPVSAFFISILLVGADAMQRTLQVPVEVVFLTQAIIVLLIVIFRE
ncbi:MAG: ABC transporter permease [Halanaerobiales bacterium]|nr:ABC transporter permease [Halanaerobiales bacterium]